MDVCITACPSPQAQADALELMANETGRVLYFGGLPEGRDQVVIEYQPNSLPAIDDMRFQLVPTCGKYREGAKLRASGGINLAAILSASYPIRDIHKSD